jgi:PTH1 family peptidyl-tRNA hydrolase
MFLVVGLGNPGEEYARTRHNAGFWVVERLCHRHGAGRRRRRYRGRYLEVEVAGHAAILFFPLTYMNRSGEAVAEAAVSKHIPLENIIVVHDDLDFPFGDVRVKKGGGTGGHKGLESIVASLGATGFNRVRVGIGRPESPGESPRDYVLSPFDASEEALAAVLDTAADCVEAIISEGVEAAMARFNRREERQV